MTPWHAATRCARRRGGDNFLLAPRLLRLRATGWKQTERDDARAGSPLATAMAISGAAANPRGGFGGTGPTTSYVVVARHVAPQRPPRLLAALGQRPRPIRTWLNPFGNHFVPSAVSLIAQALADLRRATDGGHFENLGLYELVRRRCGLIIVCDGGDDRMASYASLTVGRPPHRGGLRRHLRPSTSSVRGKDGSASGPQHIVARKVDDEYPKDAEYAQPRLLPRLDPLRRAGQAAGADGGDRAEGRSAHLPQVGDDPGAVARPRAATRAPTPSSPTNRPPTSSSRRSSSRPIATSGVSVGDADARGHRSSSNCSKAASGRASRACAAPRLQLRRRATGSRGRGRTRKADRSPNGSRRPGPPRPWDA